jgi:hypothetical protein
MVALLVRSCLVSQFSVALGTDGDESSGAKTKSAYLQFIER